MFIYILLSRYFEFEYVWVSCPFTGRIWCWSQRRSWDFAPASTPELNEISTGRIGKKWTTCTWCHGAIMTHAQYARAWGCDIMIYIYISTNKCRLDRFMSFESMFSQMSVIATLLVLWFNFVFFKVQVSINSQNERNILSPLKMSSHNVSPQQSTSTENQIGWWGPL